MLDFECTPTSSRLPNGFGIYFHIPYCTHRCSYCDFYSLTNFEAQDFTKLFDVMTRELETAASHLQPYKLNEVGSVFFGGGTPSLAPLSLVRGLCERVFSLFPVSPNVEITLEANPETIHAAYADSLKSLGLVNRVSLGAQSFQSPLLNKLERLASPESIFRAVEKLRYVGFTNLNLDLIFGIPGQTIEILLDDIDKAASLEPTHLSFYSLTLKPAHPLYSHLLNDDTSAEYYGVGIKRLKELGLYQYEISNFSQRGKECFHNLLYWNGGDFLGIGPSASSRFFREGKFLHRKQVSQMEKYLGVQSFMDTPFEEANHKESVLEAVFLELRKNCGISLKDFSHRYGYSIEGARKFDTLISENMIELDGDTLRLCDRGRLLADTVAVELVDL